MHALRCKISFTFEKLMKNLMAVSGNVSFEISLKLLLI